MTQKGFWMQNYSHKSVFTYFNKHVVPFEVKECQLSQITKICRRVNLASTLVVRKAQPKYTSIFFFSNMISTWSHIFSLLYVLKKLTREKNLNKGKDCLLLIERKFTRIFNCKEACYCCRNKSNITLRRRESEMLLVPFTSDAGGNLNSNQL